MIAASAAKPRTSTTLPYFGSRIKLFRELFQKIENFSELNRELEQEAQEPGHPNHE
jgi:hypothetical protein